MNQVPPPPPPPRGADDDLRPSDAWRMIVGGWRWVFGVPLVLALASMAYVYMSDAQWESTAAIQIGQVGQAEVGKMTALVEAAPRAIERMKLASFQDNVLASAGIDTSERDPEARLYRSSLKLRQPPGTDLVELRVRAFSRDGALRLAEATVAQLRKSHDELARPSIDALRQQLDDATRQLERAQEARDSLASRVNSGKGIDARNRFAESALLGQMITIRDEEVRKLRERRLILTERLGPGRTYPTSLIESVHVSSRPVSPRRALTVLLAAAGGLAAGIVIALVTGGRRADTASASTT